MRRDLDSALLDEVVARPKEPLHCSEDVRPVDQSGVAQVAGSDGSDGGIAMQKDLQPPMDSRVQQPLEGDQIVQTSEMAPVTATVENNTT